MLASFPVLAAAFSVPWFNQPPVTYSRNQREEMNAIAIKKKMNLRILYRLTLNSSTRTSSVAIYTKVPALILIKIPVTRLPWSDNIQPIPTPIGFMIA